MTITGTQAYEAMRAHHRMLGEQLTGRADAVSSAVAAGQPSGAAVAALVAYLAEEVLPHAAAEETAIYPVAATHHDLTVLVREMIVEHATLSALVTRLAAQTDGAAAAERARQIAGLFAAHAAKENDVLLPALLADQSVDLPALLRQLHHDGDTKASAPAGDPPAAPAGDPLAAPAGDPLAAPAGDAQAGDAQGTVLSLLLQATAALARAGEADRACRIAASAWAALHETRPDLAARVTAALHGLVRRVGEAPAGVPAEVPAGAADGGGPEAVAAPVPLGPDLDVRELPPARRHTTIFDAYLALPPGTGFVLVNDHDPKPLRYQFEAEHPGEYTWNYLETGPRVWRVRIGRAAA